MPHNHKPSNTPKIVALWIVGILTSLYVIAELVIALMYTSLVLLSDAFHNLSDVVSIAIAFWAIYKSDQKATKSMSYGWRRSEVVGALINACSLVALCLFIALEAIPRFVHPEKLDVNVAFLTVASCGLVLNVIAAIIFGCTGTHAHAHAHEQESIQEDAKSDPAEEEEIEIVDGKIEKDHDDLRTNQDDVDEHHMEEDHHHHHKKKKKKKHHHHHHQQHEAHKQDDVEMENIEVETEAKPMDAPQAYNEEEHGSEKKKKSHSLHHDHGHSHSHSHGGHDMNIWAVFIHFLGDAIASVFVLATAIILWFYQSAKWAYYLDPVASLIIVGIMLWTTIPLVSQCAKILLQRVPHHIDLLHLKDKLLDIPNVVGIHDLHVWQLTDGMTISTVHLSFTDFELSFNAIELAKNVFHKFGIHSTTIQTEIISPEKLKPTSLSDSSPYTKHHHSSSGGVSKSRGHKVVKDGDYIPEACEQNCTSSCEEDWCCKDLDAAFFPHSSTPLLFPSEKDSNV